MSKIKFKDDETIYDVELSVLNKRTHIGFSGDIPSELLCNGFVEVNEHNGIIQADFSDYKYIYKIDSDMANVVLTTDSEDVYIEPVAATNELSYEEHILTEEEIAEQERLAKIANLNYQISVLKEKIKDTDYQIIKTYEYSLVGKKSEYDIESLHIERQSLRDQINVLEEELASL